MNAGLPWAEVRWAAAVAVARKAGQKAELKVDVLRQEARDGQAERPRSGARRTGTTRSAGMRAAALRKGPLSPARRCKRQRAQAESMLRRRGSGLLD